MKKTTISKKNQLRYLLSFHLEYLEMLFSSNITSAFNENINKPRDFWKFSSWISRYSKSNFTRLLYKSHQNFGVDFFRKLHQLYWFWFLKQTFEKMLIYTKVALRITLNNITALCLRTNFRFGLLSLSLMFSRISPYMRFGKNIQPGFFLMPFHSAIFFFSQNSPSSVTETNR